MNSGSIASNCASKLLSMTILSYIFRNFSEIQSTFLFGETLRVFQWNVLAQSLGKENDNFVR